eukprot:scaffold5_cov331-Pavlova_lutheri.AAC.85
MDPATAPAYRQVGLPHCACRTFPRTLPNRRTASPRSIGCRKGRCMIAPWCGPGSPLPWRSIFRPANSNLCESNHKVSDGSKDRRCFRPPLGSKGPGDVRDRSTNEGDGGGDASIHGSDVRALRIWRRGGAGPGLRDAGSGGVGAVPRRVGGGAQRIAIAARLHGCFSERSRQHDHQETGATAQAIGLPGLGRVPLLRVSVLSRVADVLPGRIRLDARPKHEDVALGGFHHASFLACSHSGRLVTRILGLPHVGPGGGRCLLRRIPGPPVARVGS